MRLGTRYKHQKHDLFVSKRQESAGYFLAAGAESTPNEQTRVKRLTEG
jgi:hypothetical protein